MKYYVAPRDILHSSRNTLRKHFSKTIDKITKITLSKYFMFKTTIRTHVCRDTENISILQNLIININKYESFYICISVPY